MTTIFEPEEIAKVPSDLRLLMQRFPLVFDNCLEVLGQGKIKGPIETIEIYADDDILPCVGKSGGTVYANPINEKPTAWTVFANGECGYVQVQDRVLTSRLDANFLEEFK